MNKIRGVYERDRGSDVWWIIYWDADGRRRREKVGRKSAAIQLYRKRKVAALEGRKLPEKLRAKAVSFSEIGHDALEYSKANKLSYGDDLVRMRFLFEWFGSKTADSIRPQDIERCFNQQQQWKPATFNRYRALMSLAYRLGIENGRVVSNPVKLVKPKRENNARIRFLSEAEESRLRADLIEHCPHHVPEFDVAIHTGLRLGEQYGLKKEFVDFERRVLTIPRSKHGEIRHVPLNDAAFAALQTACRFSGSSEWVFLNRFGDRISTPREWFDPAVKRTSIEHFSWHCLRHTFASRLVMAGVDIRTVQELMGHRVIQMTVRYAHLAPKHQLAAVQRLCDTGRVQNPPTATTSATSDFGDSARIQ
jgi:integrase